MSNRTRIGYVGFLNLVLWCGLLLSTALVPAVSDQSSAPRPLPTFADSRSLLPEPIIEDNPDLVDLYWFCWELAFSNLRRPSAGSPMVADYVDEAFSDANIFQWDTHFMILYWKYAHHIFPAIESHDNFYQLQRNDGLIGREFRETDGKMIQYRGKQNVVNPPLFAWVEVEWWRATGDDSRFATVLPVLESYMEWIERNRKYPKIEHNLYWQTNLGSGMDNSPRVGTGWVDLSAQMALAYSMMSVMAREVGQEAKGAGFEEQVRQISERINFSMWSEKDGLYYEIFDGGEQYPVKTVACFWPMLAQIVPPNRMEKLVANLGDPIFWRKVPFPSLAADQPAFHPLGDYWMGGVWAPSNYMVVRGLEIHGRHSLAHAAALKYLQGMKTVFQDTGTVWENYAPDEYEPGNNSRGDFVGWSGLGPITMLIESVIGVRMNAPERTVEFHVDLVDRHGVERLRMGDTTLSLIAQRRTSNEQSPTVEVTTDSPITVIIHHRGTPRSFAVTKGSSILRY